MKKIVYILVLLLGVFGPAYVHAEISADDKARGVKVDLTSPEVIKIYNSIIWPEGSVQSTNTSSDRSALYPNLSNANDKDWNTLASTGGDTRNGSSRQILTSSLICKNSISAKFAGALKKDLTALGIDASSMTSDSKRYVDWQDANFSYLGLQGFITMYLDYEKQTDGLYRWVYVKPQPLFGYCLDKDYVSNYSAYQKNFKAFVDRANAIILSKPANVQFYKPMGVPNFNDGTAAATNIPGSTVVATTTNSTTQTSGTMASTSYSVIVDYNHFAAEARKYGYTSVYESSGKKLVSIVVFKFSGISYLPAAQVIEKINSLGYRPATLDEVYAARSQAGGNVVGLGTNLGGTYGYPYTSSSSLTGLSRSMGPFNATSYAFAAVKK